jgi:hypothetical protein
VVSQWERLPGLCTEGEQIDSPMGSIRADEVPWLLCCLPDGHEPPHYDYERRLWWFKPEAEP